MALPVLSVSFVSGIRSRSSTWTSTVWVPLVAVQVFDQSYAFPQGQSLPRARPSNATSSQDGDLTVVHRTVSLDPAADR